MKTLIFLILVLSISVQANTRLIQVHINADGSCRVIAYVNADGSQTITDYSSVEAAQKIVPLLNKTIHGLPRNADVASIWFNDDTTVSRIDYHNVSRNKDEAPQAAIVKGETLKPSDATAVDTLKADVLVKTGTPPDVKPTPTPPPEENVDPLNP